MNFLHVLTDNIQPKTINGNIYLHSTATGNIIAGAATTTLFNINAKSIQLTGATSLTGNTSVSGNVVVSGNVAIGSTNIISADNIQPVGSSDIVNLYTNSTGNIIAGAATTTLFNINAKSIQLTGATSLTGNTSVSGNVVVGGNVVVNGNISVGANTISNPSFVLTGNVGNVAGSNLTFGVASSSGSYSTTAVAGDVVVRTSGANNLLLQTGQGTAAIKIDSSNNVNVANYLLLNSTTTDNLRAGTGSGSYFYINNVGTIGYNSTWSITNNGNVTASYINVSDTINLFNGIVYMKESWGFNIHGDSTHPVKIPDASLIVGLSPSNSGSYGSGIIFCNSLTVGSLTSGGYPCRIDSTISNTVTYTYFNSATSIGIGTGTGNYSLYTAGRILCTGEINIISDQRIKKNVNYLVGNDSLELLRKIKPCTFYYIDELKSSVKEYGFIAQDIKEVVEEAVIVNTIPEYIPNIYCKATIQFNGIQLVLEKNIDNLFDFVNKKIKLYNKDNKEIEVYIIDVVNNNTIFIDTPVREDTIFVYGSSETDVMNINKNTIYTILTSAVQQMDTTIQKMSETIQSQQIQIDNLFSKFDCLLSKIV